MKKSTKIALENLNEKVKAAKAVVMKNLSIAIADKMGDMIPNSLRVAIAEYPGLVKTMFGFNRTMQTKLGRVTYYFPLTTIPAIFTIEQIEEVITKSDELQEAIMNTIKEIRAIEVMQTVKEIDILAN